MAQGVAWAARERGRPVHRRRARPRAADQARRDRAARRRGDPGAVRRMVADDRRRRASTGVDGVLRPSRLDDAVMAGNGTIGLELLEDLPDVDAVVVPWGGGGLTCGIASARQAAQARRPDLRGRARDRRRRWHARSPPASRAASSYTPSFVDGSGSKALLPKMWELGREPDRRRPRRVARRDRRRGAPAGRARPRRRRGRRRARARRGARRAAPATGRSPASCRAATSTPSACAALLAGDTPAVAPRRRAGLDAAPPTITIEKIFDQRRPPDDALHPERPHRSYGCGVPWCARRCERRGAA